ncbi:MAG: hypothetical protein K9H61_13700 [Bacteroidia bacterium]|nr:hypothetical protein [Bacteroidia bacterium]MCF8448039.1 hypothetical protein [Bacteroidia bacterium]
MKKIYFFLVCWMLAFSSGAQIGLNLSGGVVISTIDNKYLTFNPTVSNSLGLGIYFRTSEHMEFSLDFVSTGGTMSTTAYSFASDDISEFNLGTKQNVVYFLGYISTTFNTRVYIIPDFLSLSAGLSLIGLSPNIAEGSFGYYLSKEDSDNKPFTGHESYLPAMKGNILGGELALYIQPFQHVQVYAKYMQGFGSIFEMGEEGRRVYRNLDEGFGSVTLSQIQAGLLIKLFRGGKAKRF